MNRSPKLASTSSAAGSPIAGAIASSAAGDTMMVTAPMGHSQRRWSKPTAVQHDWALNQIITSDREANRNA
ncbi:MAG: hypothetical protein QOH57_1953 [Mycobacterium sp.]|jgi:hypothetical protein|nr:hypothetical protein [Mycobacterium sp.]